MSKNSMFVVFAFDLETVLSYLFFPVVRCMSSVASKLMVTLHFCSDSHKAYRHIDVRGNASYIET